MYKIINRNIVNYDEEKSVLIGSKEIEDENKNAINTADKIKISQDENNIEKEAEKEKKDKEEKESIEHRTLVKERKAQIQKLEMLKDTLKNEAEELERSSKELSNEMLEKANKESREIIRKAKEESETLLKKSKEDGYSEGFKKSLDDFKSLLEEAKGDIEEANRFKEQTISGLEAEIIDMVLSCVNKIIRTKITKDNDVIVDMILEAIESLNSREKLTIKISSEDFDSTSILRSKILAVYPGIKDIEIKIIDGYKSGDMEIESDSGVVNPSITSQINRLQEQFLKMCIQGE